MRKGNYMKVSQIKSKVAAKVAKGKAKVAAKCGKAAKCAALVFCLASLVLAGCQNPAQRAQTAETRIYIYEGATANFGNEFVSLAQSNETGGNDAGQTASPTTETKPEIAVGVGGSSAGVGQSAGTTQSGKFAKIGAAADAVTSLVAPGIGGDGATDATDAKAKINAKAETDASCPDGNCELGDCPDGNCAECRPAVQ